ncbi:MAG: hypothetical protein WC666_00800, partial [Candidatus Paceibacterota bacterium]
MVYKNDYGFEYINSLCQAIEQFTSRKDPSLFIYKGANLKYALERALYSTFADNKKFYLIFKDYKLGNLEKHLVVNDHVQKELICLMCNLDKSNISIKKTSVIKKILRSILRRLIIISCIHKLSSLLRILISKHHFAVKKYKYLFSAKNKRTVEYFQPIISKIQKESINFTYNNRTASYMSEKKIPYLKVFTATYIFERWAQKDSLLKQFSITERFDLLYEPARIARPEAIMVTEGNASEDEILNQICKLLNIKSICIQQGWSPIIHNGFRNMTFDKMLIWGKEFANTLLPYNPKQRFVATGSHIISTRSKNKPYKLNSVVFFLQTITLLAPRDVWEKYIEFIIWIAENYKNLTVIIREHPAYPIDKERREVLKSFKNVQFMNSGKYSLDEI